MQKAVGVDAWRPGFVALVSIVAVCGIGCAGADALPARSSADAESLGLEASPIERRAICVGSAVASAGTLGDTLYYRATELPDGKLVVGYFAFFSEERPWGNNWLTWTVLPALAVDLVYSHGLFFEPGLQRALSGKGDVEGFRIVYDQRPDGTLRVEGAVADDGSHDPVYLTAADVLAIDPARPTLYSDVWSHQLGGRGKHSRAELSYVRCFDAAHIALLPDAVEKDFALAGRAKPAHGEGLGGRMLGAPVQEAKRRAAGTPPPL
ncbi:MAG TPA: hypothetical protein VLT33_01975 [Labilithrix sp.]|nr:hypothetical protein [Labilithrix sp.]